MPLLPYSFAAVAPPCSDVAGLLLRPDHLGPPSVLLRRNHLWPADLLLRREPLRLCGLLLGRDRL